VQSNDNDREIVVVVHWESSRRQAGNRPGTPTREAPGTPHTPAILPSNVATPACSIEIEAPWTVHGLSAGRISSRPRGAPDRARPLCSDSCVASRVRLSQTLICAGHVRLSPASIGGRKRSRRHSTAVFLAGTLASTVAPTPAARSAALGPRLQPAPESASRIGNSKVRISGYRRSVTRVESRSTTRRAEGARRSGIGRPTVAGELVPAEYPTSADCPERPRRRSSAVSASGQGAQACGKA
jgi:hypothetical protein